MCTGKMVMYHHEASVSNSPKSFHVDTSIPSQIDTLGVQFWQTYDQWYIEPVFIHMHAFQKLILTASYLFDVLMWSEIDVLFFSAVVWTYPMCMVWTYPVWCEHMPSM